MVLPGAVGSVSAAPNGFTTQKVQNKTGAHRQLSKGPGDLDLFQRSCRERSTKFAGAQTWPNYVFSDVVDVKE